MEVERTEDQSADENDIMALLKETSDELEGKEPEKAPAKEEPQASTEEPEKAPSIQEATVEAQPTEEGLPAPQHWKLEHRELFSKQPREVQEFLLQRHKDLESDYTRKTQEVAETRRRYEELDRIIEPHQQQLNLMGMSAGQYISRIIEIDKFIAKDPVAGLQWLANQHRVNLADLAGTQEETYEDPAIKELRDNYAKLQRQFEQRQQYGQSQAIQSAQAQIDAFSNAKDEKGALKHPYFKDVEDTIVNLMKAEKGLSLDDAYDKAVWANPIIRQKLVQAENRKLLQKEQEEARKKTASARAASRSVSPSNGGKAPAKASIDDVLAESAEELGINL